MTLSPFAWLRRLFWREPSAPGRGEVRARPDTLPRTPRLVAPGEAFTPTRPRQGRRLVGRTAELARIVQALREEGAHVVLYSERGRGKTSLANLVADTVRQGGTIVARYTCEADSAFDAIIRGLMRDLPAALLAVPADQGRADAPPGEGGGAEEGWQGDLRGEGCEAALPPGEIRPQDVAGLLSRLTCPALVCIVDEFDRVRDARTRTKLADTIKQVSDRGTPLQFVIVGVSENLEMILGQHPSIQRNLVAVHLPLLSDGEAAALLEKGARQTGFEFPRSVLARITVLARGNPYMVQLLGLRIVQAASRRRATLVSDEDFDAAIAQMVLEAAPQDVESYASLTANGRNGEAVSALRRIATAEQDAWGRIQALPEADGGVLVGSRPIPPGVWAAIEAAGLLQPIGAGSGLYAFARRSLLHYVQLLAAGSLARQRPAAAGREREETLPVPAPGGLPSELHAAAPSAL